MAHRKEGVSVCSAYWLTRFEAMPVAWRVTALMHLSDEDQRIAIAGVSSKCRAQLTKYAEKNWIALENQIHDIEQRTAHESLR